jgi:hypothetical protein
LRVRGLVQLIPPEVYHMGGLASIQHSKSHKYLITHELQGQCLLSSNLATVAPMRQFNSWLSHKFKIASTHLNFHFTRK